MPKAKSPDKMGEIQRVVARLFASKGYSSTSMREIARELGMNQSSLYHYFKGKEEILYTLMNDAMDEALATLEEICASALSPEEMLLEVLDFYTKYYAGDQVGLILLVNEMHSLSRPYYRVLLQKQRRYVHLIRSILEQLAARKKMKGIHPTVATFAFFGMVHYTIKWYQKDGDVTLDELSRYFVEIFTHGILR
ncbi:MAG: TetR family transcriptional regulator [Deltaproteobacteria bacterium]|nr:TetR family transcriptional regulator [Deltaproteobacteria bacterium]